MQTIEEHQRPDAVGQDRLLELPRLENQQSLQSLVAEDFQSRDDISMEMTALLLQRQTTDVTIPPSRMLNGGAESLLSATDGGQRSRGREVNTVHSRNKGIGARIWPWLVKRYRPPPQKKEKSKCERVQSDMEAYVQFTCRQRASCEQPKIVYSHKRREIIRQILLFHLVPVSINFVLLGLYIRRVLWVPPWPTTNILNTLQFAAKVHETLMIASLTSVLLHHIQHRLLSSPHGVPLGLVTSPFRLLDLTYLWSQEFSAASSSEKGIHRVISIVVHVYLFVLAAILGPASAISMLPRLRDWELAHTIAEVHLPPNRIHGPNPTYAYIGGQLSDIYPQRVTEAFVSRACDYGNFSQPQTYNCPRHGLGDILSSQLPFISGDSTEDDGSQSASFNVTVQWTTLPTRPSPPRTIVAQFGTQHFGSHETVVDATTQLDVITHLSQLALYFYSYYWTESPLGVLPAENPTARFNLYPGQPNPEQSPSSWKQPFVSSLCSLQRVGNNHESRSLSFDFDQCHYKPNCVPSLKYAVDVDSKFLPAAFNDTGMGFLNVSNLKISPSFLPSAAFIYTQSADTTLCLIKANWIDFTLTGFIPWYGTTFEWTWKGPEPDWFHGPENWFNETNPTQLIELDLEWLAALDNGTGKDRDHRFFERVRRTCLDYLPFGVNYLDSPHKQLSINVCMASGLSLGITEGLSKLPYHFGAHIMGLPGAFVEDFNDSSPISLSPWASVGPRSTGFDTGLSDWGWEPATLSPSEIREASTRLEFAVFEELHGYGFHGVTIILAFVALFLYVATVFVHILIMSFGTRWSSRAWKKLGEFLVLAIQSPVPSVLENTAGGVKSSSTWKARVSIQELQNGKTVGMRVVQPDLSGTQNASESKVRPDWKYS